MIPIHRLHFTGMTKKLLHGLVESVTLNIRLGFMIDFTNPTEKRSRGQGLEAKFFQNPSQQTFIKNFINGRKLVLLDASKLSQVRNSKSTAPCTNLWKPR